VASDLTLPGEFILTQRIADWRRHAASADFLERRPAVFLLLSAD